jgi:DNA-binding NarL/FixJ family response regulator
MRAWLPAVDTGPMPHELLPALRPVRAGTMASEIRLLIADGHELVRAGISRLLDADEEIAVVGQAATGEDTVALADQLRPDVVLIDARLPGLDPVEATGRICSEAGAAVMLLTGSDADERISDAVRAGAGGLLVKDTAPNELVRAVRALARGEAPVSPGLARRLITEFVAMPEPTVAHADLLGELTAREREVVALVALGLTNDEIAERLVVSPYTAKAHVSRAMGKLQARDRAKLVVFGYESGLVVPRAG